jgi:hypothetical protein
MRFLYFQGPIPLEDLCDKAHFTATRGVPELDIAQYIGVQAEACCMRRGGAGGSTEMLDLVMLALGLGFFALSVGYAVACDRL